MFRFIRNCSMLGVFLVASLFVTVNYSKHFCSKPDRHCIGEQYIKNWEKWWARFEDNHVYIKVMGWMRPHHSEEQRGSTKGIKS